VTLLVIMNPMGAVPIFLALTRSLTFRQRVVSARRASLVALGVIAAFAVFGQQILSYLHISLAALQGAGGLLLLLVALQLLTGQDSGVGADAGVKVALVPLGTPLLAGPERSWRQCWRFDGRMDSGVSLQWPQASLPPCRRVAVAEVCRKRPSGPARQRDDAGHPDRGSAAVGHRRSDGRRQRPSLCQQWQLASRSDRGS